MLPDACYECRHPQRDAAGPLCRGQAGHDRSYEKAGLLPPPPRTRADHRRYDDTAVDRLRFIQGAQRLGLRLREIKTLLEVRDTGVCPCGPVEVLLHEHVEEFDRELTRLTALRAELVRMLDVLPVDCPEPVPGTWLPRGGDR